MAEKDGETDNIFMLTNIVSCLILVLSEVINEPCGVHIQAVLPFYSE